MIDHLEIIRQNAATADTSGIFPEENLSALAKSCLPMLVFEGGSISDAAAAVESVSGCCASTGLLLAMHYIYSFKLMTDNYGDDERAAVKARAVQGRLINTLSVDINMGSMNRGGIPDAKLTLRDGRWSVSGHKIYCSGAKQLGYYFVRCQVVDGGDENRATFVLVDPRDPKIKIKDSWDHIGIRASESHDVILNDVEVSAGSIGTFVPISPPRPAEHGLWNDVLLSSMYNGIAKSARTWFSVFLRDRQPTNLGANLATVPRLQDQIGMMDTCIINSDMILESAKNRYETGRLGYIQANQVKTLVAENSIKAIEIAVKNSGNHGLTKHNPLERHWRDIQTARVNMPQPDMVYARAGKAILGI